MLDFDSQIQEAYVDGTFIGSGPFANASSEVTSVEIFILNGPPFSVEAGPVYLDDLTISSIPVVPSCGGHAATIFVDADGHIVGGRQNGSRYRGVLFGTLGADVIVGTDAGDLLNGLSGPDIICGLGGRDVLSGGLGDDTLFGDKGRDRLLGGLGNDILNGGSGRDRCFGGFGRDYLLFCGH